MKADQIPQGAFCKLEEKHQTPVVSHFIDYSDEMMNLPDNFSYYAHGWLELF